MRSQTSKLRQPLFGHFQLAHKLMVVVVVVVECSRRVLTVRGFAVNRVVKAYEVLGRLSDFSFLSPAMWDGCAFDRGVGLSLTSESPNRFRGASQPERSLPSADVKLREYRRTWRCSGEWRVRCYWARRTLDKRYPANFCGLRASKINLMLPMWRSRRRRSGRD